MELSAHDRERDLVMVDWLSSSSFVCDGCMVTCRFPQNLSIAAEVRYADGLRADIGAKDTTGRLVGVVEVIDTSRPTPRAFAAQSRLDFAYYRLLNLPRPPKRRSVDDEINSGRFRYRNSEPANCADGAWFCSADCLIFFETLKGAERYNEWDALRCDVCGEYLHSNPISRIAFRDWADDLHTVYCIHCAVRCDQSNAQWRSPGELAGGDPREWTPGSEPDPVQLFLAYAEAAFWSMVWSERAVRLSDPDTCSGSRSEEEEATTRRLQLVNEAFDAEEWGEGRDLLLPIGAPGWAAYEDEPQRMLAFRTDNCKGTAAAWKRLLSYALSVLPDELQAAIKEGEEDHENLRLLTTTTQDMAKVRAESKDERAERWRNASREERKAMLEESRQDPTLL